MAERMILRIFRGLDDPTEKSCHSRRESMASGEAGRGLRKAWQSASITLDWYVGFLRTLGIHLVALLGCVSVEAGSSERI